MVVRLDQVKISVCGLTHILEGIQCGELNQISRHFSRFEILRFFITISALCASAQTRNLPSHTLVTAAALDKSLSTPETGPTFFLVPLNAGCQLTHQASQPMVAISASALTTATVVTTESYQKLKIRVSATASWVLPIMHKTQTKEFLRSRLRCQAHTSIFRRNHQHKAT